MGLPHSVVKTLAAANATNISTGLIGQVIPINGAAAAGGGAILTTNGLGTITAGSAYVPGAYTKVPVTGGTGTGAVFGSVLVGSAGTVIAVSMIGGSPGTGYVAGDSLSATAANLGGTGSGFAVAVATGGVTTKVATLDTQRRVIITSGGDDTSINFTVNGTKEGGVAISETFAGANGSAAQSNLDFLTVTSVTHTGSVASTLTVGTNGVGSTPWFGVNWHAQPFNVELAGYVTGTVNYGWQYTYDDPNNLAPGLAYPEPFNHPTLVAQVASLDGPVNDPCAAVRLIVNSGTDSVRGSWVQAGISGQ